MTTVTVLTDYEPGQRYRAATLAALEHASIFLGKPLDVREVRTAAIEDPQALVAGSGAVVVGPGSPYHDPEAVLEVIRHARQRGVPLVGT